MKKKEMKKLKNFLTLVMLFFTTISYTQLPFAKVYAVHDGDSYKIAYIGDTTNTKIWIRLNLVDAPEVRSNYVTRDQADGRMVADYMRNYLKNKIVTVDTLYRDVYDRHVAAVYLDSVDVAEYMLKNGYGWYVPDGRKDINPKYKKAYLRARRIKIGIWDNPSIMKPSAFRKKYRY